MSKFYKERFYVFVIAFLATSSILAYFVNIRPETQTSKITVKNNFTQLSCDALIKTLEAKSIHDFYFNEKLAHKAGLEETICTLDKIFDHSDKDRALLYGFSENIDQYELCILFPVDSSAVSDE